MTKDKSHGVTTCLEFIRKVAITTDRESVKPPHDTTVIAFNKEAGGDIDGNPDRNDVAGQ